MAKKGRERRKANTKTCNGGMIKFSIGDVSVRRWTGSKRTRHPDETRKINTIDRKNDRVQKGKKEDQQIQER